ncbi:hypothetical protein LdCL_320022250 [Leishmania donovani]|uniref:ATP-dependent DNA helicase n=1 Tax=Leishmania donovani TaxID=5661 RepID=A0A3S7X5K3_LEIDO|nr:hypothetical protein LdCL_320022250 [Leishmania donovani]
MRCRSIRCGIAQKKFTQKVETRVKGSAAATSATATVHWENAPPLPPRRGTPQFPTGASTPDSFRSAAAQRTGCSEHWTKCRSQNSGSQSMAKKGEMERRSGFDVAGAADLTGASTASDVVFLPAKDKAVTESLLTREQATVCDLACQGASLFIGGEAGTGKSHLLRAIAAKLTAQGYRIAITASTGIAALNIGGNTFHSTFGVPLPTPDDMTDLSTQPPPTDAAFDIDDGQENGGGDGEGIEEEVVVDDFATGSSVDKLGHPRRLQFRNTGVLAEVDVVVIDEVSMLHAGVLESFERAARRMAGRDASQPFGGLQMILSGDFLQLTPFASVGAPFGRRRRYRQVGDGRSNKDDDCIVCQCVSPESDDAQPSADEATIPVEAAEKSCRTAVDAAASEVESASAAKHSKRKRVSRASHCSAGKGRRCDLWYYDKPMFESWCFTHHLLHVQLREPQRQQDQRFAADLNRLRQGRLPYRLSRSGFLNAAVEDAVRLLPTKGSVKNYNDRKMLELEGEERLFPTQLTMTEAMRPPTFGTTTGQRQEDADDGGQWGAALLVHYRFCSPTGSARSALKQRGRLRDMEAIGVARNLEEVCLFPRGSVQVYGLPSPLSYSTSLSAVCVRCSGATHCIAEDRRCTVKNVLEMWSGVPSARNSKATSGNLNGAQEYARAVARLQPLGALFPRELVRVEAVDARQLTRRLQPFMQESLRQAIRKDTVLQDKLLKVGCRVMLLRNLTLQYVNGSLGRVVGFRSFSACKGLLPEEMKARATPANLLERVAVYSTGNGPGGAASAVQVPVVRMDADGKDVAIPWITLPISITKQDWCFTVDAACIPLTPAYAFTVHKVQGVTLDHAVLFDAGDMFPCDHLVYVASSRVRKFEHLRIVNLSPRMISVHRPSLLFTQNIPGVEAAAKTWAAWRSMPLSGQLFYLPSHLGRESAR